MYGTPNHKHHKLVKMVNEKNDWGDPGLIFLSSFSGWVCKNSCWIGSLGVGRNDSHVSHAPNVFYKHRSVHAPHEPVLDIIVVPPSWPTSKSIKSIYTNVTKRWGYSHYKRLYGDVPPTWVAKSASWYITPILCKIWYINR